MHLSRPLAIVLVLSWTCLPPRPVRAGESQRFEAGSLIIPMDLAYQDHGMFQAYGLVYQLLRQGVEVDWVIEPTKTWHAAPCDTAGDVCAWTCGDASSARCHYPTASPDFTVNSTVVWDGEGALQPGAAIVGHGYRGGPFVVAAGQASTALAVVDAWNDQARWAANPWAQRSVFRVVTVHRASQAFDAWVAKRMVAAPTIAVFADGNEDIATGYLRAAGIPQSNGREFPAARCGACGAGTANPDLLTVESVMGEMGTCEAPNTDHRNGQLFTADGVPAYCQIMSMHWDVNKRETVECNGRACPATQAECAGEAITYHGHEVVAEVRSFLGYATHFFAECQAVNAYENTVPNPAWPFLDDAGRLGHFLTTVGTPPTCSGGTGCAGLDYAAQCATAGCDSGSRDCCLPTSAKERGAGFLIGSQPTAAEVQILAPAAAYNQLDGAFATTGGSEPAYNLSASMGSGYINDLDVTFITGPDGPGTDDVWMTGYIDGLCQIEGTCVPSEATPVCPPAETESCQGIGKVSYLGGHAYRTDLPLSANPLSQGTRLFLNALFEADCVTSVGQPQLSLQWSGPATLASGPDGGESTWTLAYANLGMGIALDAVLVLALPADAAVLEAESGGIVDGSGVRWELGSIGTSVGSSGDPAASGSRWARLRVQGSSPAVLSAHLEYRVGTTVLRTPDVDWSVTLEPDTDGDGVADGVDCAPADPGAAVQVTGADGQTRCVADDDDDDDDGLTDTDEAARGTDPRRADSDGDGVADGDEVTAGTDPTDPGSSIAPVSSPGCGCQAPGSASAPAAWTSLALCLLGWRRARSRSEPEARAGGGRRRRRAQSPLPSRSLASASRSVGCSGEVATTGKKLGASAWKASALRK